MNEIKKIDTFKLPIQLLIIETSMTFTKVRYFTGLCYLTAAGLKERVKVSVILSSLLLLAVQSPYPIHFFIAAA